MSSTTQTQTAPAPVYIPSIADAKRFATRCLREGRAIPMVYIGRLLEAGIDFNSLLTPTAPAEKKGDRVMSSSDFIPESVRSRRSSKDGRNVGEGLSRFRDREQEAQRKANADRSLQILKALSTAVAY